MKRPPVRSGMADRRLKSVSACQDEREILALLKILAVGNQEVAAGRLKPAGEVIARLRENL